MNKTRLFSLLITAALVSMFAAKLVFLCVSPGGMNDGGFW